LVVGLPPGGSWKSIVVVILTASEDKRDVNEAYRQYANSYIVKPLELESLRKMLSDLIVYWGHWNEPPP
jgi:two-component system response regulator